MAHSLAMEDIRPRLRALRAALFAAVCVTLSCTSHVLMAKAPLPLPAVGAAFAAVFALAYLLTGRPDRGFRAIAGLMVPLELAVDTLLTAGQPAAQEQVVDLRGVELGHLVERGADHLRRQVVGTHVLQRPLEGPADRRAGGGDDDCLRHVALLGT